MSTRKTSKAKGKGPGRLSAEEAADLPARLLDAAEKEFSAYGYEGSRIERIAKAASASTKTIYARYANKTELLQAVVHRIIDRNLVAGGVDPGSVEPRTFLTAILTRAAAEITSHASLSRFALAESHRHPDLAKFYVSAVNRGIERLRDGFERWNQVGLLTLPTDSLTAATVCFSSATDRPRILAVLGVPMTKAELELYVSTAVSIFLRACAYKER